MKSVYRAHHRVPELGIRPRDIVIIDHESSRRTIQVVRFRSSSELPVLLPHIRAFTLLERGEIHPVPHRALRSPLPVAQRGHLTLLR